MPCLFAIAVLFLLSSLCSSFSGALFAAMVFIHAIEDAPCLADRRAERRQSACSPVRVFVFMAMALLPAIYRLMPYADMPRADAEIDAVVFDRCLCERHTRCAPDDAASAITRFLLSPRHCLALAMRARRYFRRARCHWNVPKRVHAIPNICQRRCWLRLKNAYY